MVLEHPTFLCSVPYVLVEGAILIGASPSDMWWDWFRPYMVWVVFDFMKDNTDKSVEGCVLTRLGFSFLSWSIVSLRCE